MEYSENMQCGVMSVIDEICCPGGMAVLLGVFSIIVDYITPTLPGSSCNSVKLSTIWGGYTFGGS